MVVIYFLLLIPYLNTSDSLFVQFVAFVLKLFNTWFTATQSFLPVLGPLLGSLERSLVPRLVPQLVQK